ncbi:adenylate kinase isoenzyme 1-like [Hemitrygon akajei]|uniref:adenylate kinase isoenzyme 1-like n=1 Tax=Hemitrygon akajei TaxID=2704970 RepID=UPI003BF98051
MLVIGSPGSGKWRQCVKMREKYGFTHLSTGALLQNEANRETKRGKKIKKIMVEGGLVLPGIMLDVLKDAESERDIRLQNRWLSPDLVTG